MNKKIYITKFGNTTLLRTRKDRALPFAPSYIGTAMIPTAGIIVMGITALSYGIQML